MFYSFFQISDLVPAEQVIDIGRQAHMQCLTEERDRATIIWKKDGMTLSGGGGRVTINSQTLQIFNLQREDYGVYQCFVTRGVREVQATAQLRLGGWYFLFSINCQQFNSQQYSKPVDCSFLIAQLESNQTKL